MNFVIYGIFAACIILILLQLKVLHSPKGTRHREEKWENKGYSAEVSGYGEKAMCAVNDGRVKKQLLSNDAPRYNSNNVLKQYVTFVDQSSMYKKLALMKERRFHG